MFLNATVLNERDRAARGIQERRVVAARGDAQRAGQGRAFRAAYLGDLSAFAGARARRSEGVGRALAAWRADRPARRRAGDRQGQHRHQGRPSSRRHGGSDMALAAADAPPAARLREAGAILFSKTTMPDYGMLSSGLSSFHKLARNPWNVARNPGGSSAAPPPPPPPVMGRCTSAPTSAARSACRPVGAASSGSSRAPAASRSIPPISAASPGR